MTPALVLGLLLLLLACAVVLALWFSWHMLRQVERQRDKCHADALRKNAEHLEAEGRLEAAEYFREYANLVSGKKS